MRQIRIETDLQPNIRHTFYNLKPMIVIRGVLLHLVGVSILMLRWCSLHTLNLGPLIWTGAAVLQHLCEKAI